MRVAMDLVPLDGKMAQHTAAAVVHLIGQDHIAKVFAVIANALILIDLKTRA